MRLQNKDDGAGEELFIAGCGLTILVFVGIPFLLLLFGGCAALFDGS